MQVLVHSGGGANGAWGLGVMKYLVNNLGRDWSIMAGTSVGALNGAGMAMYSVGQAKEGITNLLRIWSEVTPDGIYKHWWPGGTIGDLSGLLWKTGLYNTMPLHTFVDKQFDQEKIAASDRFLAVAAVNLDTGVLEYFTDQDPKIKQGVMASASYPVFFMPVKIGECWYSDGGLVEIVPLTHGIDLAVEKAMPGEEIEVDVIICQPDHHGSWHAEGKSTLETLPRMLDSMTTEIANNDVANGLVVAGRHPNMKVRVWQPDASVGSGLDFNQAKVQKLILAGYDYAHARAVELGLSLVPVS